MQPDSRKVFGIDYRFGRMNAIDQFHVVRRLHALGGALAESFAETQRLGGAAELERAARDASRRGEIGADLTRVIGPVLRAIGQMPEADVDYVLEKCLRTVERHVSGDTGWAVVWAPGAGLMFQDLGMPAMVVLVWHALRTNLADFFFDLLSGLNARAEGTTVSTS